MRVLITGDSITEGRLGYSFIPGLEQRLPGVKIVNLGLGGDTVLGIMRRTLDYLALDNAFEVVVVAAGHNDIILPAFSRMSPLHRYIVRRLRKRGSIPASGKEEFIKSYEQFIRGIREICPAKIVITTLSCLNERLQAETNRQRADYNSSIAIMAAREGVILADVGGEFDRVLNAGPRRNYFMEHMSYTFIFDAIRCRKSANIDKLSLKRGLALSIDGVHINSSGAAIYSQVIADAILNCSGAR